MGERKLKECPFCGQEATIRVNAQTLNCQVFCKNCEVVMKRKFTGNKRIEETLMELMAKEWNRRAADERM